MKRVLLSILTLSLAFIGLQVIDKSNKDCINLYVDYGILDKDAKLTKCIRTNDRMLALDILKVANLEIEGTKKYGLGVVCRINGLPNSSIESCKGMPSEKAYWAILIKEKQDLSASTSEWGWGQLAINQQYLSPGDSLGLVFANNGKVRFP